MIQNDDKSALPCGEIKKTLSEKLAGLLDIPEDGLSDIPVIELRGRAEMLMSGCQGIIDYNSECVRLRTKDGEITILGREMTLMTYALDRISVGGIICEVLLSDRDTAR